LDFVFKYAHPTPLLKKGLHPLLSVLASEGNASPEVYQPSLKLKVGLPTVALAKVGGQGLKS